MKILSLLAVLFGCAPRKVYYGFSGFSSEKLFPDQKNSVTYHIELGSDSIIPERNSTVTLFLKLSFSGQHQYYPENLRFEIYEDGKPVPFEAAAVNVTTVLNEQVSYFKMKDSLNHVPHLIANLKKEQSMPDSLNYFVVSGIFLNSRFYEGPCPEKKKIKLKILWDGGTIEKDFEFELGEREYGSGRGRPYG